MPRNQDAPLVNRIARWLRILHARGAGGIHAASQASGCEVCAVLREAQSVGLISGQWPSTIAWDGSIYNFGGQKVADGDEETSPACSESEG